MNIKNYYLIILTSFLFIYINGISQGLSTLRIPKAYKIPTEEVTGISMSDAIASGNTGEYWIVYVLREGAPTYALPNNSKQIHTLGFKDILYVTDVVGDYLHISKPLTDFVLEDTDLQEYGWINKDDVMLWTHCLVTDNRKKISIKGMVINKIDYVKKREGKTKVKGEPKNGSKVPFYSDPMLVSETGEYSQMFNILYVYGTYPPNSSLEDSKSVLLGAGDKIASTRSAGKIIKGWISTDRITFWKHRVAVEMNSDVNAVKERKLNNTPVLIFTDDEKGKQSAIVYSQNKLSGSKPKNFTFKGDYSSTRKQGTWMRFPILTDLKSDNLYELGVMGEITSETGSTIFNRDQTAEVIKKIENVEKNRRNVNIVFVIDGTSSMGPYFTSLANTLTKIVDKIESANPENTIKYGATVYRDAVEGNRLIENSPLNASKDKIIRFLKSINAKDIRDLDKPEAVFYGLKTALVSQFKNKNETNIVILVGDAGNHTQAPKTKVDPNLLSDLISEKNCSVLAYQVHNDGDQTYLDFQNQMQSILLNAAMRTYNKQKELFDATGISYSEPHFVDKGNNIFVLENYPPMAILVKSPVGGGIEPAVLSNNINEIISWSQKYLEMRIKYFNDIRNGVSTKGLDLNAQNKKPNRQKKQKERSNTQSGTNKYVSSYAPGVLDMLASLDISEDMLKKLCEEKFQLYTRGLAPKKIMGQTYPLFKRNLLLTQMELLEIIQNIEKISDALSNDDRRNALVNTWIELLNKYYGNANEADLKTMSLEEVQEKVFGISPQSENVLYKYRLQDLMDPSVVSDEQLNRYVRVIYGKYQKLKHIANNKDYEYQFYLNGVTYYWLIEDYLP